MLPATSRLPRGRTSRPAHWGLRLITLGLGACLDTQDSPTCTSADTTYSCCIKRRPDQPEMCGGPERAPVATGVKTVATASLVLALRDADSFQKSRADIEEILARCARQTEDDFNRLRLGGRKPTVEDCGKVVGKGADGSPLTQAIRWGIEKHDLVRVCVEKHLTKRVPGSFSLEQRYRYDPITGRKSLISQEEAERLLREGKEQQLKGTLRPDVVIHNGDPLHPWAVYDFKFPCPEDNPPQWTQSRRGQLYQGQDQGTVYRHVFKRPVARVAPGEGILRD